MKMCDVDCCYKNRCTSYPNRCGSCINNKGKRDYYQPDYWPWHRYYPWYPEPYWVTTTCTYTQDNNYAKDYYTTSR